VINAAAQRATYTVVPDDSTYSTGPPYYQEVTNGPVYAYGRSPSGSTATSTMSTALENPLHNCSYFSLYTKSARPAFLFRGRACTVGGCIYWLPWVNSPSQAPSGCRIDPAPTDGSASTYCGSRNNDDPIKCWCDDACCNYQDCCWNNVDVCKSPVIDSVQPSRAPTGFPTSSSSTTVLTLVGTGFSCIAGNQARIVMRRGATSVTVPAANMVQTVQLSVTFRLPAGYGPDWSFYITNCYNLNFTSGNLFSYSNPGLDALSPTTGVTSGGTASIRSTMTGSSFGPPAAVTDGVVSVRYMCTLSDNSIVTYVSMSSDGSMTSTDHNTLVYRHPAGEGICSTSITVATLLSTSQLPFAYSPPTVTAVNPSTGVVSGMLLSITGTNFGFNPTVTITSKPCVVVPASITHTSLTCAAPPGDSRNQALQVTVGKQTSNIFYVTYAPPAITSITPGPFPTKVSTQMTINGSSFSTMGQVQVGSVYMYSNDTRIQSWGSSAIVLQNLAGQGENIPVYVFVGDQSTTTPGRFSYIAPVVSNAQPNNLPTVGGQLTITGTNFGTDPTATVSGVACTNVVFTPTSTPERIVCTAPAGYGNNKLIVVTAGSQSSPGYTWRYTEPVITSITPANGPTNGGYDVTIVGSNFGDSGLAVLVSSPTTNCVASSYTNTRIICELAAGAGKNLVVRVTAGSQNSATGPTFSYDSALVTSILPLNGPTAGGTQIAISGSNFGATGAAGALAVTYGNGTCTVTSRDHSLIQCTTAVGGAVNLQFIVRVATVPATMSPSGSMPLFSYLPPTVTVMTGRTSPTLGGTQLLTIQGSSFATTGTVTIVGASSNFLCPSTSWGHSQIICRIGPGQGSDLPIRITTTFGQTTTTVNAEHFVSYNAPSLAAATPMPTYTEGGISITLAGSNFGTAPSVSLGGNECVITSTGHSQIVCTTPSGMGTALALVVTAGNQASNTLLYSYAAPLIETIVPQSQSTVGGVNICLNGHSFGSDPATISVTMGFAACPVVNRTHTRVCCTLPSGAGSVLTQMALGTLTSNQVNYNYAQPVITTFTPQNHPARGGTLITINGANFGPSPSVKIFNRDCIISNYNTTTQSQIVCTTPAAEGRSQPILITTGGYSTSVTGYNVYLPVITSITTADNLHPTTAHDITIQGTDFSVSANAQANSATCSNPVRSAAVSYDIVVCQIVAGAGRNIPVIMSVAGQESAAFNYNYDAPVITGASLFAADTTGGAEVTLTGRNFGPVGLGTATLGSRSCVPVASGWGHTQIRCSLPAGQGVGLFYSVSRVGETATYSTQSFAYNPPTLTRVDPGTVDTAGNVPITITGTNFGVRDGNGDAVVTITDNNGSATINTLCPVTFQTHLSIVCSAPVGFMALVDIGIVVATQSANLASAYGYDRPRMYALGPSSYSTGGSTGGGALMTIQGTSFGSLNGQVIFMMSSGNITGTIASWAHARVTVNVPEGSGRNIPVTIYSVVGQTRDQTLTYSYADASITDLSPATMVTGPDTGDRTLTISGLSFGASQSTSTVTVAGKPCAVSAWGHSEIRCHMQPGQGINLNVVISVTGKVTNPALFSFARPTVTAITPANGPTKGDITLTLTGTSFGTPDTAAERGEGNAVVTVAGLACPVILPYIHTQITCTLPAGIGSNNEVVVKVGLQVSPSQFYTYAGPSFVSISPTTLDTAGGRVKISGTELGSDIALVSVSVGGQVCIVRSSDFTVESPSADPMVSPVKSFECDVPAGTGRNLGAVLSVGSASTAVTNVFSYNDPYGVTFSPTNAPSDGGTAILLTGNSLGLSPNLRIGSNLCRNMAQQVAHQRYTCTLMAGQERDLDVTLLLGTESYLLNQKFSYDAPNIVTASPLTGPTGGGTTITLTGTSFGVSGTIYLGGTVSGATVTGGTVCPVVPSSYSHNSVRCNVPAGFGADIPIRLVSGGQIDVGGPKFSFSYGTPTVTSISPSNGPAVGSTPGAPFSLTIIGTNFGASTVPGGTVTIGGQTCARTLWSHTRIECDLPAGFDLATVIVSVGSPARTVTSSYQYKLPTLTSISPLHGPTTGTTLTFTGTNFGTTAMGRTFYIAVSGAAQIPLTVTSSSMTEVVGTIGEGVGVDLPFGVYAAYTDQQGALQNRSLATSLLFSYDTQTVTAITSASCVATAGNTKVTDCPVLADGVDITIAGTNFGPVGPPWASPQVLVGSTPCTVSTWVHTSIVCRIKGLVGYDLDVTVQQSSRSVVFAGSVSFKGPRLTNIISPVAGSLASTVLPTVVTIAVEDAPAPFDSISVTFGPTSDHAQFVCAFQQFTPGSPSTLQCQVPPGVGKDLAFVARFNLAGGLYQISQPSSGTVSYPSPLIVDSTLAAYSSPSAKTDSLIGTVSQGQLVVFDVDHVGVDASLIRVYYKNAAFDEECTGVAFYGAANALLPNRRTIQCATAVSPGSPQDGYHFRAMVLNQLTADSNFVYAYPEPPAVSSVTAPAGSCTPSITAGLPSVTDCVTNGGFVLTITGSKFPASGAGVRIGSYDCPIISNTQTQILCTVAPGVGRDLPVVVSSGSTFSTAQRLVSFAGPALVSVTGCSAGATTATTVDCSRTDMPRPIITISGANFGPSGATVYIGDNTVAVTHNAANPNGIVTFPLPVGFGVSRNVLLVQAGGSSGSGVSLSYVSCPIGTHETTSTACEACQPGYFAGTVGKAACDPCSPGTFQLTTGQTSCNNCPLGRYSAQLARTTECDFCAAGYTATSPGVTQCTACSAGRYRAVGDASCQACPAGTHAEFITASVRCIACEQGKFSIAGSVTCNDCSQGTYSAASATVCTKCPVGQAQPLTGQSGCVNCVAGTYMPDLGQGQCLLCSDGTYSASGSSACTNCARGKFSAKAPTDVVGPTTCTDCAIGFYAENLGQGQCTRCPAGKYNNNTGLSACTSCETGRYGATPGLTVCTDCDYGTYQDVTGTAVCKSCEPGRFIQYRGQTVCTQCARGQYTDVSGRSTCSDCVAGRYADNVGTPSCIPCGSGTYSSGPAASSCTQCLPGTAAFRVGESLLTGCTQCEAGKFAADVAQATCTDCPVGTISVSSGRTVCSSCNAGSYNDELGRSVCKSCAPGEFSQSGASKCEGCPSGRYVLGASASQCTDCASGRYSSAPSSTVCTDCAAGRFMAIPGQSSCTECPAGRYSSGPRPTVCSLCAVGRYQTQPGQSTCIDCDAGYFASAAGQASCQPCARGEYSDLPGSNRCKSCDVGKFAAYEGLGSCTDCASGTYAPTARLSSCLPCPAGSFNAGPGLSTCTYCGVGTYQRDPGTTVCNNCDAGRYAPSLGLHDCIACKSGTYQDESGRSVCKRCNVGTFSSVSGQASCTNCTTGSYAPAQEAVTCLSCPRGSYQDQPGQSDCVRCSVGTVQPTTGQSTCTQCAEGSYQAESGQGSCTLCHSGSYQDETGKTLCKPCPAETYSVLTNTSSGATFCTPCPSGSSQPSEGQAMCNLCAPGTYTSSTGCELCPRGTFQDTAGATSCTDCAAGRYAPETGMLVCLQCGIGTFNTGTASTACQQCQPGEYQDNPASTSCKTCAAGSVTASAGQAVCGPCARGTYDAVPASDTTTPRTRCTLCAEGTYQDGSGFTTCKNCERGRFSANTGQVDCLNCPQGKYTNVFATTTCTECEIGRYADEPAETQCIQCQPGRFAPETGSFACVNCPAGKYQDTAEQSACIDCPNGRYIGVSGRSMCDECPPGTYTSGSGLTACNNCPPGEYSDTFGAMACTACTPGTFQTSPGSSFCNNCSVGRFSPLSYAITCSSCAPGTYTETEGNSVCTDCETGRYQFSSGRSTCDYCAPGSANSQTRQTKCALCNSGYYSANPGQVECDQCDPGSYSLQIGSMGPTSCTACAVGRYQVSFAQSTCLPCQPGRFASSPGTISCDQCDLGEYTSVSESASCTQCSAGSYTTKLGSMVCTECGVGFINSAPGSTGCTACPAGTYQAGSGRSVCLACTPGNYQPEPAQSYCLACPLGTFSNADGKSCSPCPVGTFNDRSGSSECTACPAGSYQTDPGQAQCKQCNPGFYTNTPRAVSCVACEIGKSQPFAGGEGCLACAEGTYNADPGQARCLACPPGMFNTDIQSTTCSTCKAGKYQAVQGATACTNCTAGYYSADSAVECTFCDNGMVNELAGQAKCTLCDPNFSQPNRLATECECLPGYYLPDYTPLTNLGLEPYVKGTNDWKCYPCPTGADCTLPGSKWSALLTLPGWWRATNESAEFYRCLKPDSCPGGLAQASTYSTTSGSQCAEGLEGNLCSACKPGLKSAIGGGCEPCPDDAGTYIVMIIIIVIIVALLLLSIWLLWKAGEDTLKNAQAAPKQEDDITQDDDDLYEDSDNSKKTKGEKNGDGDASLVSESLDSESEAVVMDNIDPYSAEHINRMLPGPPLPPPNFTYKLKIFITFIQIATHIGSGLEIQWPNTFKSFVQFFDFANFDYIFSSITSAECYDAVNYYSNYVVFVCLPAAIILIVMVFWIIPRHFNMFCFRHQDVYARMRSKMRSWLIILYALFLLYPVVSSTILNHYVCKSIRDSHSTYSFLLVDLRVPCKTSRWWLFAYIGIPLIALYPIGIPAFFFFLLYAHKNRLHMNQVQAQFGFLYAGYRDEAWWWEILDSLHKLFQTSILAFFPVRVQLAVGMGVAIAYLLAILILNPYLRTEDDALAMLCQNLIFLIMLAGYFFQLQGSTELSTSEDVGMTISLLAAASIFLAAFVYYLFRAIALMVISMRNKYCPKKAPPKDLEPLQPDAEEDEEVLDEEAFTSDDDEASADNNGMGGAETEPSDNSDEVDFGSDDNDSEGHNESTPEESG